MEELRARIPQLKAKARKGIAFRDSPEYRAAMEILAEDLGAYDEIPEIKLRISPEVVEDLCGADSSD